MLDQSKCISCLGLKGTGARLLFNKNAAPPTQRTVASFPLDCPRIFPIRV